MGKFFYATESQLKQINQLMDLKKRDDYVVLQMSEHFTDIVKYNDKFDTVVFLTVPTKSLFDRNSSSY